MPIPPRNRKKVILYITVKRESTGTHTASAALVPTEYDELGWIRQYGIRWQLSNGVPVSSATRTGMSTQSLPDSDGAEGGDCHTCR